MSNWNISDNAAELLQDAHVWDMTIPLTARTGEETLDITLTRAAAHGYTLASVTISSDWEGLAGAMKSLSRDRAYFLNQPEKYYLVESFDDVEAAKQEGKLAILFHFQGTNPLEGDLNLVETYYKLGVRHMLIAYNMKNVMGDGCMERTNDGLSRLGVALIEEMNRVGMIVDATHTGYRTTMDMFEVSKDPVIFSHSNAAAIWDVPRNLKDDQIKACVRTGGVICINSVDVFLGETGTGDVIPMMVQHIDYVSELVGAEHVGIGTDYEAYNYGRGEFKQRPAKPADPHLSFKSPKYGGRFNPMSVHQEAYLKASGGKSIGPDWADCYYMDPQLMPELTETLLKHGYNETEVRGILGENIMRVAKQVWK